MPSPLPTPLHFLLFFFSSLLYLVLPPLPNSPQSKFALQGFSSLFERVSATSQADTFNVHLKYAGMVVVSAPYGQDSTRDFMWEEP